MFFYQKKILKEFKVVLILLDIYHAHAYEIVDPKVYVLKGFYKNIKINA